MRKLFSCILVFNFFAFNPIQAQQLLTENFDYPASQPLTSNGWIQNGTVATSPILVSSSGLTYSSYVLSGIGNAAILGSSGQDVYKDAKASVSSGNVYVSFMLNVDTAKGTGDYFFSMNQIGGTGGGNTARIYIKMASAGYYKLGISKGFEPAVYSVDSFAIRNTTLVVLKYHFVTGNANDTLTVFNFSSGFPSVEPRYGVALTNGGIMPDPASLGRLMLSQGTQANAPALKMDGIRVANNWTDLNSATTNNPAGLVNFGILNITSTSARISWTRPTSYSITNQTILVFMKKGSAIIQGTPTYNPAVYIADTNFSGSGSAYQNDAFAKCIYKGDSASVMVSGLQANSPYYLLAYVVNNMDSAYSFPSVANGTTPTSAPNPASGFTFTATGKTSINLSWTKATNYNNTNHVQLVYLKPLVAITNGSNTANPAAILADSNFSGSGTAYPFDGLAKCVYKGDSNRVSISGLSAGTTYYAMLLGVSVMDSVYSNSTLVNGITNSNGPAGVTAMIFNSGTTTTAKVSWTKPGIYDNPVHTTLLFLKEASSINPGVPTIGSTQYIANSDIKGFASKYQFDTSAICVFNSDTNFVNLTNLKPGTTYYLINFVVSEADSLYSNPTSISGTSRQAPLGPVTNASMVGLNATNAKITWVKPTGYLNAYYSTLVFVKPLDPINVGIPTKMAARYTANTNIAFGSIYQNDTLAHCVFRADTNFVNISGLVNTKIYKVLIFIVRDADSSYSLETLTEGSSSGLPPYYTIGQINQTNTITGVVDSNGVRATLRGVVYGVNLINGGIEFLLKDPTGGILVYSQTKNFAYLVKESDSIEVQGTVTQTRGWSLITGLDTVLVLGTGKTILAPRVVSVLNESTENDHIRVNKLNLVNPIINWPTATTTLKAYKTGTTDTFNLVIYAATNLAGQPAPTKEFDVIGNGGQTSSSTVAPFAFNGYLVALNKLSDIFSVPDSLKAFSLVVPLNNAVIYLNGDTTLTLTPIFTKAIPAAGVPIPNYRFLLDYKTGDFTSPILNLPSNNVGMDTSITIKLTTLAKAFPSLSYGDSVLLKWTIKANTGSYFRFADLSRNITLKRGTFTGLNAEQLNEAIIISPNPASGAFYIQSPLEPNRVLIMDMTGKLVQTFGSAATYKIDDLPEGMYLIKILIADKVIVRKIIFRNE